MSVTEFEHGLTSWTVRLAIAGYLFRCWYDWRYLPATETQRDQSSQQTNLNVRCSLIVWTLACQLYLVHVYCAFAFYHDFSHQLAYEHTAKQTRELTGIDWGGGLWFNYGFTAIWVLDVVVCWIRRQPIAFSHPWYRITLHSIFAFMIFNATVVFGPAYWKWLFLFLLVTVISVALFFRGSLTRKTKSSDR